MNGMEPSRPTACALLGAVLSDTVILNSPTTTERDRVATSYLERVLALDAGDFGRAMFEQSSDVESLTPPRSSPATARSTRSPAARRCASPRSRRSARACWSAATS